ncbi:MAG TPA: thioesterase family protein [Gemmatimonadales bacterium]|nr:thioesterase family protein [Gemmatimonadales bacterium]
MFEIPITVEASHIDDLGHVNNVVYLQWVQEVAKSHWHAMANAEDIKNLGWVVTRHEMEYRAAGFLGDELIARTWIGETTPLSCERFVEIRRSSDDRVLMRARSIWIPVDRTSGRPRRIGPQVLAPFRDPRTYE